MNTLPKLGKLAPKHDPRTLRLASYLPSILPPAPDTYKWSRNTSYWGMMENDRIGDCAIAAAAHMIQEWTANSSQEITIPDDEVVKVYSAISGYNPVTGENDCGCVEIDVLNFWRKQGIYNHLIEAYVGINLRNADHVKTSIYLFGGIYVGLSLPVSAQNQVTWSVSPEDATPGSWGGHAVFIVDYDQYGLTCVTWGSLKRMTWQFFFEYCDEAYAIISPDFFVDDKTPIGFDIVSLRNDLAAL